MKYIKIDYPDDTFYHKILDFENPTIEMRINSYNDLFAIKQLKDTLDFNKIKNTKLIVPCLLDAQADKRFNEDESANLKIVLNFINDLKFDEVHIFHPHNSEVVENMVDNCHIITNESYISEVLKIISSENLILLSSDAGGYKSIMKLADKIKFKGEVYGASKSRKYENEQSILTQTIDRQDFEGKDVLIIDDLCVYGGTFIGLSKLLKERNVGKLYLAVSHITVKTPNILLWENYDKVFTTNSKYNEYYMTDNQIPYNLEIIKQFN